MALFKDQIDVNADQELIKILEHGRKRAAGIVSKEELEDEDTGEGKPN